MKKTKITALSGMLAALTVLFLFFGSVVQIFAYVAPLISGLIMIILINNVNKRSAWTVFVVSSLVAVFLLPDKECALTYVFFFGWYPMVKDSFDKIKIKILRIVAKFAVYNVAVAFSQLACIYVFGIPFDNVFGVWGIVILLLLANLLFALYDRLFVLLSFIYMKKYYSKVERFLK